MVGVAAMLAAFYFTPSSMPQLQWFTVFMIGFFLYGPQMLIGLCGAELVCPLNPDTTLTQLEGAISNEPYISRN